MTTGKVFQFGKQALLSLAQGVKILSKAVKVTLGPSGRNVLLNRPGQEPYLTKDGVTVASEVYLEDPFEDMGAQLVKSVAAKTAKDAGDGTTTATLIAETILCEGLTHIKDETNVVQMKRGMDKALDVIVNYLQKNSKRCKTLKSMKNVATVSANSDKVIGDMIANAVYKVGDEGVVTVEPGSGLKDEVTIVEGYQFDCGYISPHFATNRSKMITEFDYPYILFIDHKFEHIRDGINILEKIAKQDRVYPLVIIAEDISGDALTTLAVNHVNGKFTAVAVKSPGMGSIRTAMLQDMAAFTGGAVISKDLELELAKTDLIHLGRAEKVIVTSETTTIISGAGDQTEIKERMESIKNEKVTDLRAQQVLDTRAAKLSGKVAIIKVGGMSEVEMKERKDRIDDALFATQAAVREGVLPGGGVALLRASAALNSLKIDNKDQELGVMVVKMALTAPVCQIAKNAGLNPDAVLACIKSKNEYTYGYDAGKDQYGNMFEFGILDPTKVTRSAIQNAISVAGMLLTTQCMITETGEDRDKRLQRLQALQTMVQENQDRGEYD